MNNLSRIVSYVFLISSATSYATAASVPSALQTQQATIETPVSHLTSNTAPPVDHTSFTEAHIPQNDESSWIAIGVTNGHVAASLNDIFEQTPSDPHHEKTDNPEFFTNIRPIIEGINAQKFTLNDLRTLIEEHRKQEDEGQAEELGPDLTNVIIDSAIKIHNGGSPKEIVKEITAQQHAIDAAEKQEEND